MPRAATVHRDDQLDADAAGIMRRPGEFARNDKGAPWVTDPTRLVDAKLKKAELIELCARHGIGFDPKATVPQLKALLGDLAKRGSKVLYGRPSSLGKQIENTTNLQKWSERAVALGSFFATAGADQDEFDSRVWDAWGPLYELGEDHWNLDDDAARDVLDAIAVKAKNRAQAGIAAERGTHVHELSEEFDRDQEIDWIERIRSGVGEGLGISRSVGEALIAAWERMLTLYGFEVLAIEATCVDDVWRQAGTLDRIVRLTRDIRFVLPTGEIVVIPAGTVLILDVKTGRLRTDDAGFVSWWHAYAVQLASYAQSRPYDPDTDTRGEWNFGRCLNCGGDPIDPVGNACPRCGGRGYEHEVDQQWAIIAHLDVLSALDGEAKCRLVLVDLEAGRHAGNLCVAAREWEKRRDVFSIPTDDLCVSVPVLPGPVAPPVNSEDSSRGEAPFDSGAGQVEGFTEGRTVPAITVADAQVTDEGMAVAPPGTPTSEAAGGEEDRVLDPPAVAIICGPGGCRRVTIAAPTGPPTVVEQPTAEASTAASSAQIAEHVSVQPPAADAQRASGAAAPDAMTDEQIRAEYFALTEAQRAEVARLRDEHIAVEARAGRFVSKRDATALALGWIRPFDNVIPAPEPSLPSAPVRPPTPPDEGAGISELEANTARSWIEKLSRSHPDDFAAVRHVAKQAADAGVGFNIIAKPTVRRFEIYRALAALGRYGWSDELVRDLLAAACGDDTCRQPAVTLGRIVGLLGLDQAKDFADLACRLERGSIHAIDDNGKFRFEPAPALVGAL